ncbi:MAG: hypothetical protein IJN88_03985, partial [Clostridia bacterium]|nr:hypothetical protein [Clostridia bacterium]
MKKRILIPVCTVLIVIAIHLIIGFIPGSPKGAYLSNQNSSTETIVLYDYIADTERNAVISGQQESTWMGSADYETDYIYEASGKLPVIKG